MKKVLIFFFSFFLLLLIIPAGVFADFPTTCNFRAKSLSKSETELPEAAPNELYTNSFYIADKQEGGYLSFTFDLGRVATDEWKIFPPNASGQPSILSKPLKINMGCPNEDEINKDASGNSLSTTSKITYKQFGKFISSDIYTCNFYKLGNHSVVLKYNNQGEYKPLCIGTFTTEDQFPEPSATADIVSLNGKSDATTPWKVTIKSVNIPNSWLINTGYTGQISIWLDGRHWYDIQDRFADKSSLKSPNNIKDVPFTFVLNPLEGALGGKIHTISLKAYGYNSDALIQNFDIRVYKIGEPSPTPTPTITPSPTPSPTPIPSECVGLEAEAARNYGECTGYERCPWCQPKASPTHRPNPKIDIPNLRPLCDQLEPSFRSACWDCQKNEGGIWSAIGCLPTDFSKLLKDKVFPVGLGLAGGIAFLSFLYGAFLILTSGGNAEQIEEAKQIIMSSLAGLLLIIFSVFLLSIIGVQILQLPGFS